MGARQAKLMVKLIVMMVARQLSLRANVKTIVKIEWQIFN